MNLEMNALWTCVLVVLAGVVVVALDVCALNRRARFHDAEMTQLWLAHARVAEELAELAETVANGADPAVSAGLERLQHGMTGLLTDLQAMDQQMEAQITEMRDAPEGSRGVRNIDPEGADPS